ncbi:hypothetical protein LWI28_017557 [Acer negundo]|uniref:Uncharacterized protein n=1 Tax=Acer negundo TaxID=4023 RepID=A0AAD5INK1_ACENE|nr:hypothetical protein LWI28_017557 [Acer negundo]
MSVIIECDSVSVVSWVNCVEGVGHVRFLDSILEIREILARLKPKVVQAIELNCRITLNLFFLTRLLSIDFLQFNSLLFDAYVKFLSYGEYRIRI